MASGKTRYVLVFLTVFFLFMGTSKVVAMEDKVLEEMKMMLKHFYYEELDGELKNANSIEDIQQALNDPHIRYFPTANTSGLIDSIENNNGSVGFTVSNVDGYITVVSVYPNSQAREFGIETGNIILTINRQNTAEMDIDTAQELLSGTPDTEVELVVKQGGQVNEITLTRQVYANSSVQYELMDDGIGYVKIRSFTRTTPNELVRAMDYFKRENARGVIVDLRNNSGGLVEGVYGVAEALVPEAPITHVVNRQRIAESYYTSGKGLDMPLVLLVNRGTASAAEILVSAVKDNQVGVVVGTETYGKAYIQSVYELSDGGLFALTTAQYLTPQGRAIHRVGISPDYYVAHPGEQLEMAVQVLRELIQDKIRTNQIGTWVFMDIGKKNYFVNGREREMHTAPFIKDSATYVPLRKIAELSGSQVVFNSETKDVNIYSRGVNLEFNLDSRTSYINNFEVIMRHPLVVVDGRTFIHVRFLAEQLGADVYWSPEIRRVSIAI
ncbi:carboxyl-terminal processing protease [Desulfitispora alkaliphila]|uniref:S41 family peptidase n=1 Tax=Desulfitispora alkaliphila TaxID=622674 RepID=UPI003D21230B